MIKSESVLIKIYFREIVTKRERNTIEYYSNLKRKENLLYITNMNEY